MDRPYVGVHNLVLGKTPDIRTNPTTANAMPPNMYHIVCSVKRPLNVLLRLSARERDAFTPMIIKTIPTTKRTIPKILVILIQEIYE